MEKWQYYGLFLDEETREKLRDFIRQSKWWYTFKRKEKEYMDHCTLLHISQLNSDNTIFFRRAIKARLDYLLESNIIKAKLIISSIGISGKSMAFGVIILNNNDGIYNYEICANEIPHITICTFNGGKPVDSNNIVRWYDLDEPIEIETTLKRV